MKLNEEQLKLFADFIQRKIGIVYQEENYFQLEKRLKEISKTLRLKSLKELYSLASQGINGPLKQLLLDVATNNETSFFRDPMAFNLIAEKILPELSQEKKAAGKVKIWSCASSTGQEPYSLAILAQEFKQKNISSPDIEIYASDISEKVLERARSGLYTELEVKRGLTDSRLTKYFSKNANDLWELNSEIKKKVHFAKQNLLNPFLNAGPFDLVVCRYVLIYQTEEKKKEIIERITHTLAPKGYLLMGGSECLIGLSQDFDQISLNGAVIYQKKQ
ncbi:MAG: CheR family methyltransferase [Pseudobdellovibrionaceae bacterium]